MTTNKNIVHAHVRLRGIRPLLQHKFGPDALPLTPREKAGVAGNNPEEWRRTCMVDAHGRLYIDSTYLFAAVREGGRYIKSGRRTMLAAVAATLQVLDDPIFIVNRMWPGYDTNWSTDAQNKPHEPFDPQTAIEPPQDSNQPVYLDIRGVKNPSTRARNVRYRVACAPGWEIVFTVAFDKSIVSREQMQSALWHAGKLIGIGNGRSIGMGRFDVVSFEPVTDVPEPVTNALESVADALESVTDALESVATASEPVATAPESLTTAFVSLTTAHEPLATTSAPVTITSETPKATPELVTTPSASSNNQDTTSTDQKGAAAGLPNPAVQSQTPLDEKKLIDSTPAYHYTPDRPRQPTSVTGNSVTPMGNSVTPVTPTALLTRRGGAQLGTARNG